MKTIAIGVAALLFASTALAVDETAVVDGKYIVIASLEAKNKIIQSSPDGKDLPVVLDSKDFPNGVFVTVSKKAGIPECGDDKRLPYMEKMAKEFLGANGFKIAENAVGASLSLQFMGNGSLSFEAANEKAGHSSINGDKVIIGSGGLANAMASGGAIGAVAYLTGVAISSSSSKQSTNMLVWAVKNPTLSEHWGHITIDMSPTGVSQKSVELEYRLDKDHEATEDVVFKLMLAQWGKHFLVQPAAEVAVAPASSVASTDALAK